VAHPLAEVLGEHDAAGRLIGVGTFRRHLALDPDPAPPRPWPRRLQIDDHEGTVAVAQDVDLSGGRAMLAPLVDDLQIGLELDDGLAQGPLQVPLEAEGGDDRVLDLV
jgi:hypothetical protein